MKTGQKPAKRGYKQEEIFIDLVNNNLSFNKNLKNVLGIKNRLITAKKPILKSGKADAILVYSSPNEEVGCTIKEAEADFNQLERVWLEKLAGNINMPNDIQSKIQTCLDNRRLKKSRVFISNQYTNEIISYFSRDIVNLLKRLFTGNDSSIKYFIVFDFKNKIWYISKVIDVIDYIKTQPITVSKLGVLYFGNCLSMQRKGGNGAHIKIPKSAPAHPGNQLQFKIKPLSIISQVKTTQI